MRAPPESLSPITGAPLRTAMSMTLQIFWAWVSLSEPPNTVKSWGEGVDLAAVDRAPPRDHPVARGPLLGHAEVGGAVGDEGVPLLEGARIEQKLQPLARGELAARVLRLHAPLAAAHARAGAALLQFRQDVAHGASP